jgi:hypothetical protein
VSRLRPSHGFYRKRKTVYLNLTEPERELLSDLLDQLIDLVRPEPSSQPQDPLAAMVGISPDARKPSDPALARLFPDAYEDADAATEFRRFTESDLRATKVANASRARACLSAAGPVTLSRDDLMAWLQALNDLRLVLGTRIGVTEDADINFDALPEDERGLYLVYDWLTYHQDRLIAALPDS